MTQTDFDPQLLRTFLAVATTLSFTRAADHLPQREEHAPVVLVQPVRVAVPVVDLEEVAVVPNRRAGEHDAALRAHGHDAGRGCR